jgi:hypothetical protein
LVLALLLVSASCSGEQISEQIAEEAIGGNADVEVSGEGDDLIVNIESDEGSLSIGAGGTLPEELETPVPDGAEVVSSLVSDGIVLATVRYPADRWDEIAAFYHSWTQGTGESWDAGESTVSEGDQTQRTAWWTNADVTGSITMSDCYFAPGESVGFDAVCVSVSQS